MKNACAGLSLISTKRLLVIVLLLHCGYFADIQTGDVMGQSAYTLRSPDQKIEIRLRTTERLKYDIVLDGKVLLQDSTLSIRIDRMTLGLQPRVKNTKERTVNQQIVPVVPQKSSRIRENYNELRLDLEGNYALVFRAYNEGIAYRFDTSLPEREVKVYAEEVSLNFAGDFNAYYPKEDSFFSHNEREFLPVVGGDNNRCSGLTNLKDILLPWIR